MTPSTTEVNSKETSYFYRPGDWQQDKYTLVFESLGVALLSQATPPTEPRWPFNKETAEGFRNPSRQPGYFAVGLTVGLAAPLTVSLFAANPEFESLRHLRGLLHTHLLTEFFTMGSKAWFGRKRPFYDTEERSGAARRDDRFSFFSGHASHSFAFATYASLLAFSELNDNASAWVYSSLLFGSATWISASRAIDGQHNWSDVVTGALVGCGVGAFALNRVIAVSQLPVTVDASLQTLTISYALD